MGLVVLDLQKAFDTCNFSVLTRKLSYYGIENTELEWFKSYLHYRSQCCIAQNSISSYEIIKCEVPQGPIIGPLLFIVYVNHMPACFTKCQVNIYADDTVFSFADQTVKDVNTV